MKARVSLLVSCVCTAFVIGWIALSIKPTTKSRSFSVSLLVDGERCVYYPNGFDNDPIDPGFDLGPELESFDRHAAELHLHEKSYAFSPTRRGSTTIGTPIVTFTWATLDSPRRLTEAGRAATRPSTPDPQRASMAEIQAHLREDRLFRENPAYFETIADIREHALNYFADEWPSEVAMIRVGAPPARALNPRGLVFPIVIVIVSIGAALGMHFAELAGARRRAARLAATHGDSDTESSQGQS